MNNEIDILKKKLKDLENESKRLAEENSELSKAKYLLSSALEHSPSGIIITDAPNGNIIIANIEAVGIRGESEKSLTGNDVDKHSFKKQTLRITGEPYKHEDLPLSRAIFKAEVVKNEKVIIRQEKEKDKIVIANAAPVKDKKGSIIAGIVIFHDITELEESGIQLKKNHALLEHNVSLRTSQLKKKNEDYLSLNEEFEARNEEIRQANEELYVINERFKEEADYRDKAEKELEMYKDHLENVIQERTSLLIESEKKHRQIIQNIPSVVWEVSEKGVVDYISPNIEKVNGYSPKEIYSEGKKAWWGRIHPDDIENVRLVHSELFKTGKKLDVQYRIKHKNGKWIWLHAVAEFVNEKNEAKYAYGVFTDITVRKTSEEEVRKKDLMYQTLFDSANDAIFIMDGEIFIDCNNKTLQMFACKENDIIGKPPYKFSPKLQPDGKSSKKKALEKINKALRGNRELFYWKHCKLDGTEFDAEVSLNKLIIEGKDFIQAIVRDISIRKRIENSLKESEEKFRNIFNNNNDLIVITDLQSRFIEVNQSVLPELGYSREEFLKHKATDITIPAYIPILKERAEMFKQGQDVPSVEIELIGKKGNPVPVEINGSLINYMGKKAILTVVRNISERKGLERKIFDTMIETEEQERQRLAQDLHDDLGPLLSTLNLYIHGITEIKDEKKRDELIQKSKSIVQESASSVRQISNALSPHVLTNFGLNSAIETRLDKVKDLNDFRFETNIKDTRFSLIIETIYYRVLNELINNTIKHAKATKIIISLVYSNNLLVFEYKDNGVGFDLDEKLKSKESGLGLKNILNRVQKIGGSYNMYKLKKGMAFFLSTETEIK